MKKIIALIVLSISIIACNQKVETKSSEMKTAYIDTAKLMEEYTEAKDINEKYKGKSEEAGRKFEVEEANFKADAAAFQQNAQANGQAWAQQKGAELQKRQQYLEYSAQNVAQQLQMQHGAEIDSLVSDIKKDIKDYGKKNGYAYIFGTGEAASVLYAEDKYDITKEMIKLLNDKYKSAGKKEETVEKK